MRNTCRVDFTCPGSKVLVWTVSAVTNLELDRGLYRPLDYIDLYILRHIIQLHSYMDTGL